MNGRLDAIVATKKTFKNTMKHLAVAMILTKTAISASHRPISCWHRGEEQLRDDMDTALKSMKEDGTLTKLSIEYTGSDYNSEE